MNPTTPFRIETFAEPADAFHHRDLLSAPTPAVAVCRTTGPALVLGSAQRDEVADGRACDRRGVDVVRRRSGGGAVLVEPNAMVWLDTIVPADDPRFADVAGDVTRSMHWIGGHVRTALAALGVDDASVHDGSMDCGEWCRLVCFAGTAPGEVLLGGRKLVGISQRRTRAGARFQCAVHTRWSPEFLIELLARPRPLAGELADVATLDVAVAEGLAEALVAVLNAL